MLLIHLQEAAVHLVSHGLAKIAYPIDKLARYKINENYDLTLMERDREKWTESPLLQEYENFRENIRRNIRETYSETYSWIPGLVEVLELFSVTTELATPIDKLNQKFRSKNNSDMPEEIIEHLMKWLILKDILIQQHTVRNLYKK